MDDRSLLDYLEKKKIHYQIIEQSSPITGHKVPDFFKNPAHQLIQAFQWQQNQKSFMFLSPFSQMLSVSKLFSFLPTAEKDSLIQHQLNKKDYIDLISFENWPGQEHLAVVDEGIRSAEYLGLLSSDSKKALVVTSKEFEKHFLPHHRWEAFSLPVLGDGGMNMQEFDRGSLSFYDQLQIKQYFTDDVEFPIMSQTARELLNLRSDPDADANHLAQIVRKSPTLAAQVIRWSNSPYYGFPGSIDSIEDAIVRVLGFDLVIHLGLGLAVSQSFKTPDVGPLALTRYWQHSLYTTALTDQLLRSMPAARRPSSGICQLSALLHNFGYMVLGEFFPQHFNMINQHVMINPHLSSELIERYVLGVPHSYLGFLLMQHWSMPEELIDTNLYHHSALDYSHPLANIIYTIQLAVDSLRKTGIGDGSLLPADPVVLDFLRISEEQRQNSLNVVRMNMAIDEMAREVAMS